MSDDFFGWQTDDTIIDGIVQSSALNTNGKEDEEREKEPSTFELSTNEVKCFIHVSSSAASRVVTPVPLQVSYPTVTEPDSNAGVLATVQTHDELNAKDLPIDELDAKDVPLGAPLSEDCHDPGSKIPEANEVKTSDMMKNERKCMTEQGDLQESLLEQTTTVGHDGSDDTVVVQAESIELQPILVPQTEPHVDDTTLAEVQISTGVVEPRAPE